MTRPVIASVAYELPQSATPGRPVGHAVISERYVQSLHRAGARVVLVPAVTGAPSCPPDELLTGADGLLLIGGGDLDPSRYGEEAHAASYGFSSVRDETELALARHAVATGLPVLAICRGCQVLNVALGGSLHQHVPDDPGYSQELHGDPHELVLAEHPIALEPGSRLAAVLGTDEVADCRCCHHQSVARLGDGLRVVGRSVDGCVEAIEVDAPGAYAFGVQWHPEMNASEKPGQQALFDALVETARRRRDGEAGEDQWVLTSARSD
jgi:putative glutamine amidotransferase